MKCKHDPGKPAKFWVPTAPGLLPPSLTMTVQTCCKCGDYVSLGPSNDEPPEVKVEMRAAEQVACAEYSLAMATAGEPDECICKHGKIEPTLEEQARSLYLEHWQ